MAFIARNPFRKKKHVLLLEDDPSMQRLVATFLKRDGYKVDVVWNGTLAVQKIRDEEYDAVLLDLMMPHEGGMTVIQYLRTENPSMLPRVILTTGTSGSVVNAIRGEVFDVVQKPFMADDLLQALHRLTDADPE
jgi:DNA-binding NtrC family response regulator